MSIVGLRPSPFGPGRTPGGDGRDFDLPKQSQDQRRSPDDLREHYYEDRFEAESPKRLTQLQPERGSRPPSLEAIAPLETATDRLRSHPAEVFYFPKDGSPAPKETDPWRMTRRPLENSFEDAAPRASRSGGTAAALDERRSYTGAEADGLRAHLLVQLSQRI